MRTQTNQIVAALVLLALASGAIGCKSNGGSWYKPNSYTWYNPFTGPKSETVQPYEHQATAKPHMGQTPNVTAPPGGYGDKAAEAKFAADNKAEKQVVPQYGQTMTSGVVQPEQPAPNSVAMTNPSYAAPVGNYSTPDPYQYSPSNPAPNYQPTSISQPSYQQPQPSYQPNPADYAPQPTSTPANNGYSPFSAAPATSAPANYAAPTTYGAPQQGFGAPATTTTTTAVPASNGYATGYPSPSYGASTGYAPAATPTGF